MTRYARHLLLIPLCTMFSSARVAAQAPPSVSITPTAGLQCSDSVTVTATPSTLAHLERITLYVNGNWQDSDDTAPFSFDLPNLRQNVYQIHVVATYPNEDVSSAVSAITVGAPPVELVARSVDGRSPGEFTVECGAYSGSPGAVDYVEFRLNGSWHSQDDTYPFTATFEDLTTNLYGAEAIVHYRNGDSFGSNQVSVRVTPPKVTVLAQKKTKGRVCSILARAKVNPTAPGDVERVTFYLNGSYMDSDNSAPFAMRFSNLTGRKYRVSVEVELSNGETLSANSKVVRFKR